MKSGIKNCLIAFGGIATGFASGFFGGGGGMLAVPLLSASGLDEKHAHATALIVILPICIVSAAIYIAGGIFDARSTAFAVLGVVPGGIAGASALNALSNRAVKIIFALLMIAIGIKSVMP